MRTMKQGDYVDMTSVGIATRVLVLSAFIESGANINNGYKALSDATVIGWCCVNNQVVCLDNRNGITGKYCFYSVHEILSHRDDDIIKNAKAANFDLIIKAVSETKHPAAPMPPDAQIVDIVRDLLETKPEVPLYEQHPEIIELVAMVSQLPLHSVSKQGRDLIKKVSAKWFPPETLEQQHQVPDWFKDTDKSKLEEILKNQVTAAGLINYLEARD